MVDSNTCTILGFFGAILFAIVIVVAGKIHWGDEAPLCFVPAQVPFQDVVTTEFNETDYPNPRCASLIQNGGRFGQDRTDRMHYFWQLPEETRDWVGSQTTAWIFYALHQLAVWSTIYFAQLEFSTQGKFTANGVNKKESPKYTSELRQINWISLFLNGVFWLLHLLHTHTYYDATAPTAHEMSSQGSVILMLVFVLMMEGPKRGLFLGRPAMTWSLSAVDVVKRYHGYAFSWAVIYTFWYHPMEGYFGHLFGFMHVWLVMFQGSMMYTTAHLNRYWRMICEAWVFVHGMVISMQTLSSNSWPMFTFGFGAIFVLTQVPGLPCLQDQHIILRLLPTLIFIGVYVGVYLATPGWTNPAVVFFIPSAEYLGAIAVNYLFWIVLRCLHGKNPDATQATAAISAISAISTDNSKSKSKSGVVVELADIGKERSGGGGNGSNSSDSGGGNEKESSSAEEDSTELKNESITVAPPLDVDVVVVGEPTTTPEKRKLWIALVVLTYVIVIVCSVVAQVSLEIQGKSGGALLVYLPMCCLVPASLLMLKMALPYSKAAHEVETDRIGPRGVTRCCVHL